MSKKTKPRRGNPAGRAAASKTPASTARAGTARASTTPASTAPADRESAGIDQTEADAIVERVMSSLWAGIASGDPLRAELETATCMAIPRVLGELDPDETEKFISTVLVNRAVRRRTPDGAALLRMLMALGTQDTKRAASQALAKLTGAGIYPPDWVTGIGKVTPSHAWRRYDVFGDDEAIAVTFGYGETEHGIVVQVDLTGIPIAIAIGVSSNAARLIEAITADNEEFDRSEQISLAEARRRLFGPLDRTDYDPNPDLSADTLAYLPIARARVRRLPADADDAGDAGYAGDTGSRPVYTAADRAAAVDEFMKSPQAAGAVAADEESTRFWAEVLTGYSGRVSGEPPAEVGRRKLAYILLGHVPNTFVLSPAQRSHLEPAVTAWVRWSAGRRDLGEAGTEALTEQVPRVLERFEAAYDDPDAVTIRGYASGLAASDADVSWLSDHVGRRMFALPIPQRHAPLDLADPADRHRLVEAEFGACTPPTGMTSEEFVAAAYRVVEELWRDEDNPTYQAAKRMYADGVSRHDLIHHLAGAPVPTMGLSIIR